MAGGLTTSVPTGLQGSIKVTAWGGEEGTEWQTGSVDDIIDVTVHFGDENITRMDVTYELDGEIETNSYGVTGLKSERISFEKGEYIKSLSGRFEEMNGAVVIRKLTVDKDNGDSKDFGKDSGTPFSLSLEKGKVSGFHGRADAAKGAITALGVYLRAD